ncbi:putative beta-glucosidase BoGH3B [Iris pallida]|uniref:Beta-glucosidase BoGH3B n=1 Tax=Iris pallida TaxID=29817 RepID=A0AAX6E090_IRIPA|nr:putative beta-glucosidase BoGH3B [Iris pallida]
MAWKKEPLPPYQDASQPVEARVRDLLSRMTLREKAAQMAQIERSVADRSAMAHHSVGSVLNSGGSVPRPSASAADWADMVDQMQRWALSSRLGIPFIYGTDAVHGHNNLLGATVFPHNVGLGATRNGDLARRIGEVTALEVRASGVHYTFAPCVAVCRDPRWGRCYESYGEDTEIVRMMTPIVSGLQGSPPEGHPAGYPFLAGSKNVVACAKHFVGDGGTDKGLNEGNTICSFEDLERIHMKPYLDCFAQGVCTVMVSYSSWNGRPLHSDRYLITDILKDKLGFKGFVISDWEGIDRLTKPLGSNYRYCVSASVNAGIDMIMVPHRYDKFLEDLIYLVEAGEIPMSRINDAVERILRVKFIAGLFEHPFSDRSLLNVVGCKEHRALAREAVRKSLVLLKNGKDPAKPFFPLNKNAHRILVTGSHADDIGYQCGGWTITWHGSSGRVTVGTTILDAVKEAVGEQTEVIYEACPSPATFANQDFSYAVVVVGEVPYAEFLGDRTELNIPLNGTQTVNLVAGEVPTVVIVISGRPLVLEPELLDKIEALVAAWLPGSEGGGVTDVLFGDHDFEGTLPVTWFKSFHQLPMNADHQSYDPLFPIGFGLRMGLDSGTQEEV